MMDNRKTKTAGYGLITTGLIMAAINLATEFGWINFTPAQKIAVVEFVIQVASTAGPVLIGLGFLGLGHKSEKLEAKAEVVDQKLDAIHEQALEAKEVAAVIEDAAQLRREIEDTEQ